MLVNGWPLVKIEHLESYGGATSGGDHGAEQPCLEPMVIRVVVLLAEQDEPAWGQALYKSCGINEASSRHIPDTPGERMILAQGGLPILRPFAGVRCSDEQGAGEEEL
jgi:hypothetical protein